MTDPIKESAIEECILKMEGYFDEGETDSCKELSFVTAGQARAELAAKDAELAELRAKVAELEQAVKGQSRYRSKKV